MTREDVKELLPIIRAYINGRTVEHLVGDRWVEISKPTFADKPSEYRIKPEPKYRPFKSKEECWNEMLKHHPFGWVVDKHINFAHIDFVYNCSPENGYGVRLRQNPVNYNFESMFKEYKFADSTQFGITDDK